MARPKNIELEKPTTTKMRMLKLLTQYRNAAVDEERYLVGRLREARNGNGQGKTDGRIAAELVYVRGQIMLLSILAHEIETDWK